MLYDVNLLSSPTGGALEFAHLQYFLVKLETVTYNPPSLPFVCIFRILGFIFCVYNV